jgi:hypothetical protein
VSDPLDLLREHVRRKAASIEPGTSTDELVAHITLEHHRHEDEPVSSRRPGRRWGSVALFVAASLGIGAGAVVTAALVDRAQVTQPQLVACHPSVAERDVSVLVEPGTDPIGACADEWRAGRLPDPEQQSPGSDPPLVGCTGDRGVLEVFPGDGPEVCAQLGLSEADVAGMLDDPVAELSRRTVEEINARCLPFDVAVARARELLSEIGLQGWNVVAIDDGGTCAVVGMSDTETRTLNVRTIPAP